MSTCIKDDVGEQQPKVKSQRLKNSGLDFRKLSLLLMSVAGIIVLVAATWPSYVEDKQERGHERNRRQTLDTRKNAECEFSAEAKRAGKKNKV